MEQVLSPQDARLLEGLRMGDEGAFVELMREYGAGMLRVALMYVSSRAVAEEVVQEAWLGVLRGLERFEARSSVRTWIYTIVANIARTRAKREARSVPLSALAGQRDDADESASVDPERFLAGGDWRRPPEPWRAVLDAEARSVINDAIAELPPRQRRVIELRDVQGWSAAEVRNVLDLSETNQRVLLHRARSKVRAALEKYLGHDDG
jgi:RNA polymerase sigma-70 factor, ECF subfamily